jgi:hypothetical protein
MGHVAQKRETINAYYILVALPEGKRLLGKSTRRCEDNIKVNLKGTVCGLDLSG